MSATTTAVLSKVRRMIPPMLETFHKGQLGRVAVIGGSQDYTGAPYFSAMASARLGCDLSHVICTPAAAAVVKTYSPNLMVHPLMRQGPSDAAESGAAQESSASPDKIAAPIIDMLARLHVLVIGPGLGRDPLMQDTVERVIRAAKDKKIPMVLDADALQLVQKDANLIKGYTEAVLTPNVVEFDRLWKAVGVESSESESETHRVEALSNALGGVTIIQKGKQDHISNGKVTLTVDLEGGRKRSGGQGDTLTGSVATFLAWRRAYVDKLWDDPETPRLGQEEMVGLAAFGGSAITRECSRIAFLKRGRSLQASDLTDEIHNAFIGLFGEVDENDSTSKL
ncbi:YjeF domain containing protein [Cordyceps fumosorosea ARSEF 2679]|uniref:ATP-dependent (S)-NAD(P)H-hydrate dehydratase n=1 Tax=Cordyceps fumosorosea (strain ARSEF 2679) TaxID=1081104 RepID=A0A168DZG5_CORFA|nr:YjeF domain containing protein [Cordyceps fumosorosea ARSEF 2679]OAA73187.1 YjeF domain containing protein [Cordyceps fumosorosea ARSEF 2679]